MIHVAALSPVMAERDFLEDENGESGDARTPSAPKGLLSFRLAMGLYGVLALLSLLTLQGRFLIFMLLVLGGIAVLTYTHHLRERLEAEKPDD
jgi:hypothetical protein